MSFFHFNTLRKYTASILSLFNNIEIENTLSDGKKLFTKIPIQFANRERYDIYSQLTYNQLFTGNNQVLPRGILLFNGMNLNQNRSRNKHVKIYKKILNINEKPYKLNYQFNSIPFDFEYQVIIQCRGMNEAAMVVEQITSFFNPTYCLRIKEIDLPDFGYTSCILDLTQTNIQQSDIDDFSINVVTIEFSLILRGNIYPAIKEQETIKMVQLFLSTSFIDENNIVRTHAESNTEEQQFINQYKAAIKDIIFTKNTIKCVVDSECEKLIKFQFEWFINDEKFNSNKSEIVFKPKLNDKIKVRAFTDMVETDFFEKIYGEHIAENSLKIIDIIYDGDFLECKIQDESNEVSRYTYEWQINGEPLNLTQRIIKFNSSKSFGCKCIVKSSDGRTAELYKKIIPGMESFEDYTNLPEDNFNIESIVQVDLKSKALLASDYKFNIESLKPEYTNNPFMMRIEKQRKELEDG